MQDGWTCMTDKYATEMMHELFYSNLVSMHDKMCKLHESHEHAQPKKQAHEFH